MSAATDPQPTRIRGYKPVAMISSTIRDLEDHRLQVFDACSRSNYAPEAMEHLGAKSNTDAIDVSLAMIENAVVYILIVAVRYGYIPKDPVRNPHAVSITELEYQHAVKSGMPIFVFASHDDHQFKASDMESSAKGRKKLAAFRNVLSGRIQGFFRNKEELRTLVIQALSQLKLPTVASASSSKVAVDTPQIVQKLPQPPALYAQPPYLLTNKFVGRSDELARLDQWAASDDTVMIVEGIGGLGKSALTWEWLNHHADTAMPGLDGKLWWSFYEQGSELKHFLRMALAYITRQNPESEALKSMSTRERADAVLEHLRNGKYLVVLDGLERILTAYHRFDKAHLTDEQVEESHRDCIEPADGDFLIQLICLGRSKVLASSRLFPNALLDKATKKPAAHVALKRLNGLSEKDALAFMDAAGITGNRDAMLEFAGQFERHSLVLKVVCGLINDYRRKPRDFDAWRADPLHGGSLKLAELPLVQRKTNILQFAMAGLDAGAKTLLGRIAILSEGQSYNSLAAVNSFIPLQEVELTAAEYAEATSKFDAALQDLEDRGLIDWDRDENTYAMHPVVRGVADDLINASDKVAVHDRIRNHFENLPPDDLDTATEIHHLRNSLEIYRSFVKAGRLEDAAEFYRYRLSKTLIYHLGAYSLMLSLMKPLFGPDGLPVVKSQWLRSYLLNDHANALENLGQSAQALEKYGLTVALDLEEQDWSNAAVGLRNIGIVFFRDNRLALRARCNDYSLRLCRAAGNIDGQTKSIFLQMENAITTGRFGDADKLSEQFRARKQPPIDYYRPGEWEYSQCVSNYYQGRFNLERAQAALALCTKHRNVFTSTGFHALIAGWHLEQGQGDQALVAIDHALAITNKTGEPSPEYHDLRAWALALIGDAQRAQGELNMGESRYSAAMAWKILGDVAKAKECALNAYQWAWSDGPPYVHWYYLEQSRKLLTELGVPIPNLPPFEPAKVEKIPHEDAILKAIEELEAKNK